MVILPFLAMCFMAKKGFIYTIAVYINAYCLVFCSILPCVLHQNTLHLAPKRTAFSTKTHCILLLNTLYFAANRRKTGTNCLETGANCSFL